MVSAKYAASAHQTGSKNEALACNTTRQKRTHIFKCTFNRCSVSIDTNTLLLTAITNKDNLYWREMNEFFLQFLNYSRYRNMFKTKVVNINEIYTLRHTSNYAPPPEINEDQFGLHTISINYMIWDRHGAQLK
jgi:hypothetical protein